MPDLQGDRKGEPCNGYPAHQGPAPRVCVRARVQSTEASALFHKDAIAECFTQPSVEAILGKLDAGSTLWHAQAAHALRISSPLASTLTLSLLQRAAADTCWTDTLKLEAQLCAAALAAPDAALGARSLEAAKRGMIRAAAQMVEAANEDDAELREWASVEEDVDAVIDTQLEADAAPPTAWEHAAAAAVTPDVTAAYLL